MTPGNENQIDAKYLAGQGIRRDQTEPLFRNLKEIRKRDFSSDDSIFDIGCGPCKPCEPCKKCAQCKTDKPCVKAEMPVFMEIWIDRLIKIDSKGTEISPLDTSRPKSITGLDIHPQLSAPSISCDGVNCEYIHADGGFLGWPDEELNKRKEKFSLVTAINSWHWLMENLKNEGDFKIRNNEFFKRVETLLEDDGHLVMMHLFTKNPSPELTTIAAEALSKVNSLNLGTRENAEIWFNDIRNRFWKLPTKLLDVKKYLSDYKLENESSCLQEKLLIGTITYSWMCTDDLWKFWHQNNITGPLKTIFKPDEEPAKKLIQELEGEFAKLLNDKELQRLGLQYKRIDGKCYVLLSLNGVQQIIKKSSLNLTIQKKTKLPIFKSHIKPDLPNTVHAKLLENISRLESEAPWFRTTPLELDYSNDNDSVNEDPLLNIFAPIFKSVHKNYAEIYNVVIRQPKSGSRFGFYKQVYFKKNEKRLKEDIANIAALQNAKKLTTMSDLIFCNGSTHDDIIMFSGKNWNNHSAWSGFRDDALIVWVRPIGDNAILEVNYESTSLTKLVFEYSVDFMRDRFDKDIRVYQFFRFLLRQLRSENGFSPKKSVTLITSNKAAEDKSNTETVSMTIYPKRKSFPTSTDCFLLIDSLQTLALVRQRFLSRISGEKEGFEAIACTIGHEVIKAYAPVLKIINHECRKKCIGCSEKFVLHLAEVAMIYATIFTPTKHAIKILEEIDNGNEYLCRLSWRIYMLRDVLKETFSLDECNEKVLKLWDYCPPIDGVFVLYDNILKFFNSEDDYLNRRSCVFAMQVQMILMTNALKHHFNCNQGIWSNDTFDKITDRLLLRCYSEKDSLNKISMNVEINTTTIEISVLNQHNSRIEPNINWGDGTFLALDATCRLLYEANGWEYTRSNVITTLILPHNANMFLIKCKISKP